MDVELDNKPAVHKSAPEHLTGSQDETRLENECLVLELPGARAAPDSSGARLPCA
jgi:hypothetical protein